MVVHKSFKNNGLKFGLEGVRENDLMPLNAFQFSKKFKIKLIK